MRKLDDYADLWSLFLNESQEMPRSFGVGDEVCFRNTSYKPAGERMLGSMPGRMSHDVRTGNPYLCGRIVKIQEAVPNHPVFTETMYFVVANDNYQHAKLAKDLVHANDEEGIRLLREFSGMAAGGVAMAPSVRKSEPMRRQ